MIKLITNHPIAVESADHKTPQGAINDNNTDLAYINEVRNYLNTNNISILDLGCAGGQIVIDHKNLGDIAVGLEGSSNVLKGRGSHNWNNHHNKNLFLCDITENFEIQDDSEKILRFDIIQMWDVLEHIPEDKMSILFSNIKKHLKHNGHFIGQISQQIDPILHISVFSYEKWKDIFNKNDFSLEDYIFQNTPRPRLTLGAIDGDGNIQSGFPFTAKII
jgi:2-polyprenyl-3-methyl-5-hydroxy-6-metoxy-1,4-benzoquinol methylase